MNSPPGRADVAPKSPGRFTTYAGQQTTLEEFLGQHLNGNRVVYIGTDSRNHTHTNFSTVLVSYTPGHGGVVLKRSLRERKIESLGERLMREAWHSVELALEVATLIPESVQIEIHLDINTNVKHKSTRYLHSVGGLVAGQGFDYRVKPDAWCATCIADRMVQRV